MDKIHIISVVNNFEVYNKFIKNNPAMNCRKLTAYDNSSENIGVSSRYNDFIKKNLSGKNEWYIFCHQDFCFFDDPEKTLENLSQDFIYGVIGAAPKKKFSWRYLRHYRHNELTGRVFIGLSRKSREKGKRVCKNAKVETLDCCCIIINSKLIREHNLIFDNNLPFHLYSEDFSLTAKSKGIDTYVIPVDCCHTGRGTFNQAFFENLIYLKQKHNINRLVGTSSIDRGE